MKPLEISKNSIFRGGSYVALQLTHQTKPYNSVCCNCIETEITDWNFKETQAVAAPASASQYTSISLPLFSHHSLQCFPIGSWVFMVAKQMDMVWYPQTCQSSVSLLYGFTYFLVSLHCCWFQFLIAVLVKMYIYFTFIIPVLSFVFVLQICYKWVFFFFFLSRKNIIILKTSEIAECWWFYILPHEFPIFSNLKIYANIMHSQITLCNSYLLLPRLLSNRPCILTILFTFLVVLQPCCRSSSLLSEVLSSRLTWLHCCLNAAQWLIEML